MAYGTLMFWALCLVPHHAFAVNNIDSEQYAVGSEAWKRAGNHLNEHIPDLALHKRQIRTADAIPLRVRSATQSDIHGARDIVQAAMAEAGVRNQKRMLNPARNTYYADQIFDSTLQKRDYMVPQLPKVSDEAAAAAALLAEVDSLQSRRSLAKRDGNDKSKFWMENIARKGSMPWGDDPDYQVFRNVKDFGAKGDGIHDDTFAIRRAILAASGKKPEVNARCTGDCAGSTTQNAIVYFPSGTYLVSGTIPALPATQLIGDATNPPTLKAAPSFLGLGVISTKEFRDDTNVTKIKDKRDDSNEVSTAAGDSFYRQIRNLIVDITSAPQDGYISGIHYHTSQAASLSFVEIHATSIKSNPNTTQIGIFSENGSGGQISDLTVVGGKVGFYGGNSQFTAQRIKFRECGTAVRLLWDWSWVWKSVEVANCNTGFQLHGGDTLNSESEPGGYLGSIHVMDSTFDNVGTAVRNAPASHEPGEETTSITLDNVVFTVRVEHRVWDGEKEYVQGTPSKLDTWTLGALYLDPSKRDLSLGFEHETRREDGLTGNKTNPSLPKKAYFERSKPQYTDVPAQNWVHTKDSCKGDGKADDTACLQKVLDKKGYIFVDAGVYLLSNTVTVHPGTFIVGEAWSQLVAQGNKFSDAGQPRPMIRVGSKGDKGSVEMQDLLFTTKGATSGAILVEWNIKAEGEGKAGMWDCHARVGGARGTELTPKECPASPSGGSRRQCHAAALLMHITPGASAYLENVWLWAADHMVDGALPGRAERTSVYAARGMLIESSDPTWLYGTSAEHAAMYQYNFYRSKKVFAAMIRTEAPFFQDERPMLVQRGISSLFSGDPICTAADLCGKALGAIVKGTKDVTIAGADLFSGYNKDNKNCASNNSCQNTAIAADDNQNLQLGNVVSVGANNTIVSDKKAIPAKDNVATNANPKWSQINSVAAVQSARDAGSCRNIDAWPAKPGDGKYFDPIKSKLPMPYPKMFINMVNGSPLRFNNIQKNSYQIKPFDFADVDPGFSPQVSLEYGPGTFTDCNGEAGYQLNGTGSKFQIRATTNDKDKDNKMRAQYKFDFPVSGVQQGAVYEMSSRGNDRAVNFVLTGSDKVGYWSSLNPPVAWMTQLLPVMGGRKLRHISMLGSHNAGISVRTGGTIGPSDASICQGVDVLGQLQAGARWFDVRPVIGNGGQLLTGHYSGQKAPVFGISGQAIDDIVGNVNAFTRDNAELVVLSLTHAMQTDEKYRDLDDGEWDRVFDAMEKLDNRCGGLKGQIPDMKLGDLIGKGRACVIVLADGGKVRPDKGIYRPGDSFDFIERWSNVDKAADMAADQESWVRANRNLVADDKARKDKFAISQWILTVKSVSVLTSSIEDYALNRAYDPVFWRGYSSWSPWSYPSVVLMDFVGIINRGDKKLTDMSGEVRALIMAVNLGLASRNCWVGGGGLE
ncbi:glucan 1 [Pyricularia oryzae]|nr:glucan 1 [Pyricularia oryzae]